MAVNIAEEKTQQNQITFLWIMLNKYNKDMTKTRLDSSEVC